MFVLRNPPNFSTIYSAYPYQLDAIRAVRDLPYAAFFHEQGLGKTKIAIDLALLWLKTDIVDTVFVITKKSLVENWRKEIETHCYVSPHVLSGNRRQNSVALNAPGLLYVANYEVIAANQTIFRMFLKTCRVACFLDESQKIKNPNASLTKVFLEIANLFERRVIITGTPVANRPQDIWSQIKFLDHGAALGDSYESFKARMDLPKDTNSSPKRTNCSSVVSRVNTLGNDADENVNYGARLSTIHQLINSFTVRETKQTSGLQLPKKIIRTHSVVLPTWQWEKYRSYRDELAYEFKDIEGELTVDIAESILKRLLRLVQCASNPALIDRTFHAEPGKFSVLSKLCDEFTVDSKVIVWTNFVQNVEWLASKLREFHAVKVHGQMSILERNSALNKFLNSQCRILVATPGSAKEGLTLTVANHAIFFDRSFSLDDYLQAQDRIHRISQHKPCYVHNLIASNTIDEWVDVLLNAKYLASQMAHGDIDIELFTNRFHFDISELLRNVLMQETSATQNM